MYAIARRVPLQRITIVPLRLFSAEVSSINQPVNINVPGLSENVVKVPNTPVGPGASKNKEYKNPEYFCYHVESFGEAEVELVKYRLPVPSNKRPFHRTMDSKVRMAHYATKSILSNKDETREMMAVWPDIVRDITDSKISEIPDISKWMAKVLQYNVPGGKKNRGLALVYAYKLIAPSDQLTEENIRLARILAWCVELLQAFLLLLDDIEDGSLFRRNQPCWYRHNDIGLTAINDGIMLESAMYFLIRKHFKGKECYLDLIETFQHIILATAMGQSLDLLSTNFGRKPNLDLFTMDRYSSIVKYKTSYYTFILPITAAMLFAGIKDPEMLRQTKTILFEMGHCFQVQDDYLGCYGKSEVCGKDSTDIQEGKCTWLIVMALQRATSEQRKILEECYGVSDPEKVECVKQLYNDLGLPNIYSKYEEEMYNLLNTHIQQISRGLPHELFLKLLDKIYRRMSFLTIIPKIAKRFRTFLLSLIRSICAREIFYELPDTLTIDSKVQMAHNATKPILTNEDEIHEMMTIWPDIVRDITDSKILEIPDVSSWVAKVLQYNVPGGKKNRGLTLVYAYKLIAPSDQLTEDNIRLARILAWCVELFQAFMLLIDDIEDRSLYRRNQPCWYRHNNIGLAAINDGIMLECVMYFLIRKHFKGKECYLDLIETFQHNVFMTTIGQSLDLLSTNFGKKPNLDLFTMDRYNSIVKYKTSYYTFILPITAAMNFAEIKDPEMFRQTETILFEMGPLFQIQDDYLGCYGKSEVIGKVDTDIQEGKCTWLIVNALERATSEQRKILEKCYGVSDPEKIECVRQLYNDLGLPNIYSKYEEETYNLLKTHIQQLHSLPHDLFLKLLDNIYHRKS
ncbi:uncharacterized protein Ndufv3 [Anoplolepis gracilipes]|uniref:uncharacterized protein Ndufv3 n=1 Tax=Anoplolepis gracilipes TaxID=354296 RepID=UPI003B9F63D6